MVTAEGTPKLLDFGIAKILQPVEQQTARERTVTLQPMMTPEYASPEQLESRPVTTASDVYSLGVVLYLLLTGRRRYMKTSADAGDLAHAIRTEAPIRPSTAMGRTESAGSADKDKTIATVANNRRSQSIERLRKELAGDLDAIVLKSLEKDAARRYTSAEHACGEPSSACGEESWDRRPGWLSHSSAHAGECARSQWERSEVGAGVVAALKCKDNFGHLREGHDLGQVGSPGLGVTAVACSRHEVCRGLSLSWVATHNE